MRRPRWAAATRCIRPPGIILVLGVQYAPLVFLMLRAALRALPQELIEAGSSGRRGAGDGAAHDRAAADDAAACSRAIALCFVSCLGNFGIPALLGIPGNYRRAADADLPAARGTRPAVLPDVAVLSLLIGSIAVLGIVAQDTLLRARDFRISTATDHRTRVRTAALAPARRNRAVVAARRRARRCR